MARKKIGDVELQWTCPNCNGLNPGSARFCQGCGSAQPDDVKFELGERQELLTDEEKIKQAQQGPDIHCPYCEARNPAGTTVCTQCGGDLSEGAIRESGQVLGAYEEKPAGMIACPHCGAENPDIALKCSGCGGSLSTRHEPETAAPKAEPAKKGISPWVIIGVVVGVVICGLAAYMIYRSAQRDTVTASVQQISWEYVIPIEALQDVTYQDWRDELPAEADVGECVEQVRDVVDSPVANSVEVCGTPYTVDSGSGFGEVVQDCTYEVYAEYCTYTLQEWQQVDQVVASGSDFSPYWPELALLAGQREGEEREENYVVIFKSDNDTYSYRPDDISEYQKYQPDTTWTLTIDGFGNLVGVQK